MENKTDAEIIKTLREQLGKAQLDIHKEYQRGYHDGYHEGYAIGSNEGYHEGYSDGCMDNELRP